MHLKLVKSVVSGNHCSCRNVIYYLVMAVIFTSLHIVRVFVYINQILKLSYGLTSRKSSGHLCNDVMLPTCGVCGVIAYTLTCHAPRYEY